MERLCARAGLADPSGVVRLPFTVPLLAHTTALVYILSYGWCDAWRYTVHNNHSYVRCRTLGKSLAFHMLHERGCGTHFAALNACDRADPNSLDVLAFDTMLGEIDAQHMPLVDECVQSASTMLRMTSQHEMQTQVVVSAVVLGATHVARVDARVAEWLQQEERGAGQDGESASDECSTEGASDERSSEDASDDQEMSDGSASDDNESNSDDDDDDSDACQCDVCSAMRASIELYTHWQPQTREHERIHHMIGRCLAARRDEPAAQQSHQQQEQGSAV